MTATIGDAAGHSGAPSVARVGGRALNLLTDVTKERQYGVEDACRGVHASSTVCGFPASRCYGASCPGLVSARAARAATVVAAVLRSSENTPPE
jgi:hypothetical protein